jgi:hypothetical protein
MAGEILGNLGYIATEDGRFVSQDHMRIAEIIQDYNPDLALAWIPPELRRDEDKKVWAVLERGTVVATFEECDERILEHIWRHDNAKHNVLADLEAHNAAIEAINLKKQIEESEARQDLVASVIKSPLHWYKLKKGLTIEDHGDGRSR